MRKILKMTFTLILSLVFFACNDDESITQESQNALEDSSFAAKSIEAFENVSSNYPEGDVLMTFFVSDKGFETAKYSLTGESLEIASLGKFASKSISEGTECSSAISCGKEIKKCLDNGQDALISNGPCATYCVTCQG